LKEKYNSPGIEKKKSKKIVLILVDKMKKLQKIMKKG
jgi:hypothetical protein